MSAEVTSQSPACRDCGAIEADHAQRGGPRAHVFRAPRPRCAACGHGLNYAKGKPVYPLTHSGPHWSWGCPCERPTLEGSPPVSLAIAVAANPDPAPAPEFALPWERA
jgi:hypothetical protein